MVQWNQCKLGKQYLRKKVELPQVSSLRLSPVQRDIGRSVANQPKILAKENITNHELYVKCYNLTGRDLIEKSFKLVTRLPLLLHRGAEGQLDQGAQGAVLHVGDEEVKNFLVGVLDCPV